jgi:predicted outer membrane protein
MRCVSGLTALLVLAGCTSQGSEAAERRADTARRRDSIAGVAAGSMTENNIVALLELTHAADSALGSLGAAKHHALRKDAEEVAARLGLTAETPRVPPDEPPAAMRDSVVNAAPGGAWDRAYLDYAIAVHRSAMENTARALAATKQPEVKSFIEKSVPIIQKHLDKAQSLQKNLK